LEIDIMAKLKQVIGAILSDITKGQAISDGYSRDLKSSYREDPILKLLSVPRTEIKEVTIDLKFAILKGENDKFPDRTVIIYQDGSYQGASQELREGSYDIESLTIGNDQLSSLTVPKGMKVTLYEHGGFSGRSKIFTEDTPWVGDDFNDVTSSIKVEQIVAADIDALDIEVVTDYLTTLPEAAISSISIKLDMTSL
jgi:hypothetical protein